MQIRTLDALWENINRDDIDLAQNGPIAAQNGQTFGQPTQQTLERLFDELLISPESVFIDLGCGTGAVLFHAAVQNISQQYFGVEIDNNLLNIAQTRQQNYQEQFPELNTITQTQGDILDITVDDLNQYSENGNLQLILFSFDARFPDFVTKHIIDLVKQYNYNIKWITTHSGYKLDIPNNMFKLNTRLTIGPPGIDENTYPVLTTTAYQMDNYPEDEHEELEELEMIESRRNFTFMQEYERENNIVDPMFAIPNLELFYMYVYISQSRAKRRKNNESITCVICAQIADKMCSNCKQTFYCSLKCQAKDWRKNHRKQCEKLIKQQRK